MVTDDDTEKRVERQMQIMTSMHFALSSSRSSTVYEAVGRAGMYLTTASMTLVALGFISSATSMDDAFYLFAFVLLSCLFLLGLVTFFRVVQTGVEDVRLALSESRIREFYAEVSPGVDKWFDHPVKTEKANQLRGMGSGSRFQMLLTAGSMIGGVNSAVIGAFVGLAVARFAGASLTWAAVAGAATFAVSAALHLRQEYSMFAGAFEGSADERARTDDRE
ncbi:MAG: hypothetical protein H7X75_04955 [Burkholderiaceae bacterium]|nr:hypothetical protein [Burkholderiaceae bacterium]